MKNFKRFILGCSCILFLSISNVAFASTGKVTGKTVRIRESADGSSNIITNAYRNDEVTVLEESGAWYKVEYEGKTGYISKEFVEVKEENIVSSNAPTENANPSESQTIEDSGKKQTKIEKDANLKLLPNFSSRSLGVIQVGTEIEVKREVNNWIQITAGSNTGWILKNYAEGYSIANSNTSQVSVVNSDDEVSTENESVISESGNGTENQDSANQKAYINIDTARVRETAGGKIIGNLDINDVVTIIGEEGDWYKITCTEFPEGYVSKSLVTIGSVSSRSLTEERQDEQQEDLDVGEVVEQEEISEPEIQPEPEVVEEPVQEVVPEPDYNADLGSQVVAFAEQYIGYPYVSGGASPSGFDCSGFTSYVYSNFGYSLNRTASGQTANGMEVSREDLQPGDIILFQDYGRSCIGHAAIYIGDGNFIHAANPSRGVVIDNLDSNSYYNIRFVTARRIV